ncbi:MAG: hypothetical protein Q8P76_01240 [bacterium]|nr:hypothetical protein [bacterium]
MLSVIAETMFTGGAGGEAEVLVQKRNIFPGIGGTIQSQQVVIAALRKDFGAAPGSGDHVFLKHLIVKKLDDYFCRTEKYAFSHVARPLGSMSIARGDPEEAYFYDWVHGSDGFAWVGIDDDNQQTSIILEEWNEFVNAFSDVGIKIGNDVTNAENALVSQNIVHQAAKPNGLKLNLCWKRIDFGSRSLQIDYEKLMVFLVERAGDLNKVLGESRCKLLYWAWSAAADYKAMSTEDKEILDKLVLEYRLSSLRHRRPRLAIE